MKQATQKLSMADFVQHGNDLKKIGIPQKLATEIAPEEPTSKAMYFNQEWLEMQERFRKTFA